VEEEEEEEEGRVYRQTSHTWVSLQTVRGPINVFSVKVSNPNSLVLLVYFY
jgi:hypothetical protein